jgi:glycosyltransferase involved in cell wall biosynthesis
MKRIAALVPNILGVSPGQRVRIESWAGFLKEAGWVVDFYPFEDARLHEILYQSGHAPAKAARLAQCYLRQLRLVSHGPPCDILFIYREAALIGPALLERLAKRRRVPVIYDVDDPVFLPYRSPMNGWFSLLKFPRKTYTLFRLSSHVIAINQLIAAHAANYSRAVSVIPNCIDIERYHPRPKEPGAPVRLVWMGSHSTMPNLATIAGPLKRLQETHHSLLRVIGVGDVGLPEVTTEMRQWSASTEVSDLQDCDIGLVPLTDLDWNSWKFFFKTVQYMAVGLPVIARRLGSNSEIIEHGVNGFLVETQDEWYNCMRELATNHKLRLQMGAKARATVVERYSTQKQMPRMISVFEQVLAQSRALRPAYEGSNHLPNNA